MQVGKTQAMEKFYGIEKENRRNNFSSWNVICLRLPGSPGHRYIITMGGCQRKVVHFKVFFKGDKMESYLYVLLIMPVAASSITRNSIIHTTYTTTTMLQIRRNLVCLSHRVVSKQQRRYGSSNTAHHPPPPHSVNEPLGVSSSPRLRG